MATTNPVSGSDQWNYVANSSATTKTTGDSTLGKDQFLKILITQLQNQDPMQPMEDKEFIAQMAQFSSVEQLMNISTQLTAMNQSLGSVSGLIGKDISWTDTSNDLIKNGTVESIVVSSGVQYAVVGNDRIALTDIMQIQNAKATETASSSDTSTDSGESGATT